MKKRRILVGLGAVGVAAGAVVTGSMVSAQGLPPAPAAEPITYSLVYESAGGDAISCVSQAPELAGETPAHPSAGPAHPSQGEAFDIFTTPPNDPGDSVTTDFSKNDELAPTELQHRVDSILARARPGSAAECDRLGQHVNDAVIGLEPLAQGTAH